MGTTYASQSLLTSTRTTGQTVLDSDGDLKWALHNLVPNCDLSDTGDWTHENLGNVVESGTSPSGKAAYLVTEDSSNNFHRLHDAFSYTSGSTYSFVYDVKTSGRDFALSLPTAQFGAPLRWSFDLSAGTTTQITGGTNDSASITPISDGWYRCVLTAECISTGLGTTVSYLYDGSSITYTGDGTSGVYLSRPRVYRSAIHSPSELVTNGDFATDTDWTKGTGWTIGSGVASKSAGTSSSLTQAGALTVGSRVAVTFTVSNYSAGAATPYAGGTGEGTPRTANGTYTEVLTVAGNTTLYIHGSATFVGDIDNISVVEILDDGMQLGSDGTDYVETSGSAVYHAGVAYDGSGSCLGMQSFEGRTNLATHSNDFTNAAWGKVETTITADAVSSPDGNVNAGKFVPSVVNTVHNTSQTGLASTAATFSVFAKAGEETVFSMWLRGATVGCDFDLSTGVAGGALNTVTAAGIEDWGNGWYRCWVYDSTPGTTVHIYGRGGSSFAGNASDGFYLYGAQFEAGSFPTPYIPTGSAAVARGADSVSLAVADFGFNASEGVVVVTFQAADSNDQRSFSLDNGSSSNQIIHYNTSGNIRFNVENSGTQANIAGASGFTADTEYKMAMAYKANDFGISVAGATAVSDASGSVPVVDSLKLGVGYNSANHLNGYIKSLAYYPVRLSDATLEAESA